MYKTVYEREFLWQFLSISLLRSQGSWALHSNEIEISRQIITTAKYVVNNAPKRCNVASTSSIQSGLAAKKISSSFISVKKLTILCKTLQQKDQRPPLIQLFGLTKANSRQQPRPLSRQEKQQTAVFCKCIKQDLALLKTFINTYSNSNDLGLKIH